MNHGKTSSRHDALFAGAVIGAVFAMLAFKTWRRWPDLVIDFGAQLYMPWQISTGAMLYRDVHYLAGGPLSQYYHALLFKIFGVSFLTLVVLPMFRSTYRHQRVRGGAGGVCLCPLYDGGHFQLHHSVFRRSRAWVGVVGANRGAAGPMV